MFAAAGGVPALVRLLDSDSTSVQNCAAVAVGAVCHRHHRNANAAVAAGAVPALLRLACCGGGPNVQLAAAEALGAVCLASPARPHLQAEAAPAVPVVDRLAQGLSGDAAVWDLAAAFALDGLCRGCDANAAAAVAAGVVPPLTRLLSSAEGAVRKAAVSALASLSLSAERAAPAIIGVGAVPPLVRLFRGGKGEAEGAAVALRSVTASGVACTAAVVGAGALAPLAELPALATRKHKTTR